MLEKILVGAIIIVAVLYVAKKIKASMSGQGCGCGGCSSCSGNKTKQGFPISSCGGKKS